MSDGAEINFRVEEYFFPLFDICHHSCPDITQLLFSIIENMTGIKPEEDSTLDEVGLASVSIPVLVARINSSLSTKNLSTRSLSITAVDLMRCKTIRDIGECIFFFYRTWQN